MYLRLAHFPLFFFSNQFKKKNIMKNREKDGLVCQTKRKISEIIVE
jgi:hypothetical protein